MAAIPEVAALEPAAVARLEQMRARLRARVAAVEALVVVRESSAGIERLLTDLDAQLQRSERAAVIALVGATGAGKSTLLNALIGADVSPVGPDRPTTRLPVIFAPEDADVSELLGTTRDGDGHAGRWQVERYRARADHPGYVVIDTPDTNSVSADPNLARSLAERCDILIVVFHRQSIVEREPVAFLDEFARRRALVLVLNRTDELTEAATQALVAQIQQLAQSRWHAEEAPVLALSAHLARSDPSRRDWVALLTQLDRIAAGAALRRVRRFNALGTSAQLAELFQPIQAESDELLAQLPVEVERGMEELIARLADDSSESWRWRRSDLGRLLAAELGRRWEGPSGWALRVGGLETIGLGLGAVLLRRHPLVAAGSALGSTVASRAIASSAERDIGDSGGLSVTAIEFENWYAAAMSPARLLAARLTGDPGAFGIPSRDEAHESADRTVRDLWLGLVQRQVPRAIERGWTRWLHLPLDLPLYAFAIWIIFRVATGFVAERYAGVDFLVNAALLGFTYLVLVRLLTRRLLAWKAKRLAAEAAAEARLRLTNWRDTISANVRTQVAAVRQALAELARPLDLSE